MSELDYYEPMRWDKSITSISLGELEANGLFDYENDEALKWDSYNFEQYSRLCGKILERFRFRDIGIIPYRRWRYAYVRRMNEIMPKYKLLYAAAEEADVLQTGRDYGKSRYLRSDMPQTRLDGANQDYASSIDDQEHETVHDGDYLDKFQQIAERYNDIDVLILDELESLFSCLMTVSINGF